jgi:serine phosphatase RsbU (regulator of sigma subunit)
MDRTLGTLIAWGAASRPLAADGPSGDGYVVLTHPERTLVAVVDGLGRGHEAAAASHAALRTIARDVHETPIRLVEHCHRQLRGTRGVVLALAVFEEAARRMDWIGVGDVNAILWRADHAARPRVETLFTARGIVGRHLPPLVARTLSVAPGDTLVLATDGVARGFPDVPAPAGTPEETARRILERHGTGADDALVVVADIRGEAA